MNCVRQYHKIQYQEQACRWYNDLVTHHLGSVERHKTTH